MALGVPTSSGSGQSLASAGGRGRGRGIALRPDALSAVSRASLAASVRSAATSVSAADSTSKMLGTAPGGNTVTLTKTRGDENMGAIFEDDLRLVNISASDSPARRAGLGRFLNRKLTHIGDVPVSSIEDVKAAAKDAAVMALKFEEERARSGSALSRPSVRTQSPAVDELLKAAVVRQTMKRSKSVTLSYRDMEKTVPLPPAAAEANEAVRKEAAAFGVTGEFVLEDDFSHTVRAEDTVDGRTYAIVLDDHFADTPAPPRFAADAAAAADRAPSPTESRQSRRSRLADVIGAIEKSMDDEGSRSPSPPAAADGFDTPPPPAPPAACEEDLSDKGGDTSTVPAHDAARTADAAADDTDDGTDASAADPLSNPSQPPSEPAAAAAPSGGRSSGAAEVTDLQAERLRRMLEHAEASEDSSSSSSSSSSLRRVASTADASSMAPTSKAAADFSDCEMSEAAVSSVAVVPAVPEAAAAAPPPPSPPQPPPPSAKKDLQFSDESGDDDSLVGRARGGAAKSSRRPKKDAPAPERAAPSKPAATEAQQPSASPASSPAKPQPPSPQRAPLRVEEPAERARERASMTDADLWEEFVEKLRGKGCTVADVVRCTSDEIMLLCEMQLHFTQEEARRIEAKWRKVRAKAHVDPAGLASPSSLSVRHAAVDGRRDSLSPETELFAQVESVVMSSVTCSPDVTAEVTRIRQLIPGARVCGQYKAAKESLRPEHRQKKVLYYAGPSMPPLAEVTNEAMFAEQGRTGCLVFSTEAHIVGGPSQSSTATKKLLLCEVVMGNVGRPSSRRAAGRVGPLPDCASLRTLLQHEHNKAVQAGVPPPDTLAIDYPYAAEGGDDGQVATQYATAEAARVLPRYVVYLKVTRSRDAVTRPAARRVKREKGPGDGGPPSAVGLAGVRLADALQVRASIDEERREAECAAAENHDMISAEVEKLERELDAKRRALLTAAADLADTAAACRGRNAAALDRYILHLRGVVDSGNSSLPVREPPALAEASSALVLDTRAVRTAIQGLHLRPG